MTLDRAFRLSAYLTLIVATLGLVYAIRPHLPEVDYLVLPVAVLLLTAGLAEGRWLLPTWAANLIGAAIIGLMGCWVAPVILEVQREGGDIVQQTVRLMPFLGALLLVLLLAKLFRPKRPRDWLQLQCIAFFSIALACTLDSDFIFGGLLLAYLACGLWSLCLFHLYRERTAAGLEGTALLPWRRLGVGQALRPLALLAPLAFGGFLLTPRQPPATGDAALPTLTAYQSGVGEAVMDLNRTGTLYLNTEVAFEVEAEDADGAPKLDLPGHQRWRSVALNHYERGRWTNHGMHIQPTRVGFQKAEDARAYTAQEPPAQTRDELPNLGDEQYFLTYSFPFKPPRRVLLAEPVVFSATDRRVPVAFFHKPQSRPWGNHLDMEVLLPVSARRRDRPYIQVMAPPPAPDLSSPVLGASMERALTQPADVPGLREWTDDVLDRLVAAGKISAGDLQRGPDDQLSPAHQEKIGRALEAYLATSGEFTYNLKFARSNLRIDPTFDFLRNVRQGHCERFAGGLALMLRSQGIPARIVLGFHGAEHIGEGHYLVRHSDAHSWVEMLVQRESPDGARTRHWLTLDPTPAEDVVAAGPAWFQWWRGIEQRGSALWSNYLIEYSPEQRDRMVADLGKSVAGHFQSLSVWGWFGWAAGVVAASWMLRRAIRWMRRRPRPAVVVPAEVAFYGRMLRLITRRLDLWPGPGQTAYEFTAAVGSRLRAGPATAAVADVPAEAARLYYRARFARRPLDAAERIEVEQRIGQLEAALHDR